MYHLRRLTIASVVLTVIVFTFWLLPQVLNPTPPTPEEKRRDKQWVDSSPYWLDRQCCRWFGLCGLHHLRWDAPARPDHPNEHHPNKTTDGDDGHELLRNLELRALFATSDDYKWLSRESLGDESWEIAGEPPVKAGVAEAPDAPEAAEDAVMDGSRAELRKRSVKTEKTKSTKSSDIPKYVLDYAPLVHLFSGENFWPSHIEEHVRHMLPYYNKTLVDEHGALRPNGSHPLALDNLYETLSHYPNPNKVCLTSEVDIETRPEWLHSHDGIPVPFPDNEDGEDDSGGGGSGAPGNSNQDVRNGHDYEQPDHQFADDTTWFNVDKDHPLNRISDPRKLPTPQEVLAQRRIKGPQEARARQLRQRLAGSERDKQVVFAAGQGDADAGNNNDQVHGYKPDESGYSKAPAVLVMVDKGSGILDAFWFFFYSYNLGQTVLKVRYGNHVGDWEHCMIRFENGVPRALFLSEHAGGQAYAWQALEKFKNATATAPAAAEADLLLPPQRPVIYSAVGSHAMYALPGTHPYVLPFKMLRDETDKGPLWDPAKNHLAYHYDYVLDREQGGAGEGEREDAIDGDIRQVDGPDGGPDGDSPDDQKPGGPYVPPTSLTPASSNPDAPTSWFHFRGLWGDDLYELGDPRQWRLFGQYHYTDGPAGPKFKNLGRQKVCQTERCRILYSLDAGKKASWYS
ncbi:Vacuolar protein sorting-associated protein 62 [Sporothrix curviconia]|uniref:Vacuolar protein sorting-associated protein 62 n=1 Tax=Sporothrix curviconia TaxID=1260050 RepID=A0ABP0AYP2_9PEZI